MKPALRHLYIRWSNCLLLAFVQNPSTDHNENGYENRYNQSIFASISFFVTLAELISGIIQSIPHITLKIIFDMSIKIVARISWFVTVHLVITSQMKVVVAILASFHCVMNFSLIRIRGTHHLPRILKVIYQCILVTLFNHGLCLQAVRSTIFQKAVLDCIKLQVRNPKFLN